MYVCVYIYIYICILAQAILVRELGERAGVSAPSSSRSTTPSAP